MTAASSLTEAVLIEMDQRFRRLQGAINRADLLLAERERHYELKIVQADADLSIEGKYESTCRIIAHHERSRDHVIEIRSAVERSMEECHEDLLALLERVRTTR